MNRISLIATGMVCATTLVISTMVAVGGELTPPAGAINPTERLLESVTNAKEINSVNTPGTIDSVFCIDQPGSYILTQDIIVPAGKHGIKVTTDTFIIDHRGHEIRGLVGSLDGIHVAPIAGPTEFEGTAMGADIRDMGGNGISVIPPLGGIRYLYTLAANRIRGVTGDGIFKSATGGSPQKDTFTVDCTEIDGVSGDGINAQIDGAGESTYTYLWDHISNVGGNGIVNTSMASSGDLELAFDRLDIDGTGAAGVVSSLIGTNVKNTFSIGSQDIQHANRLAAGLGFGEFLDVLAEKSGIKNALGDLADSTAQFDESYVFEASDIFLSGAGGAATSIQITPTTPTATACVSFEDVKISRTGMGIEIMKPAGNSIEDLSFAMKDCQLTKPGAKGVVFDNGILNSQKIAIDIEKTNVTGATGTGLDLSSFVTNQATSLKCTTVENCGGVGASLGNHANVHKCNFNNNSTGIFFGNDCIIKDTMCNRNSANGMNGQIGNHIANCTASFNDLNGIVLMNKSLIDGAVANNNGRMNGDGISVGNDSTVRNSVVTHSAGTGINAAAFTTVNGNTVSNSGTTNIQVGDNAMVTNNNVRGGIKGIILSGTGGMAQNNGVGPHSNCGIESQGNGNTVADNTVNGTTTGTGISVLGMKTVVRGNHVTNNATGIAVGGQNNLVIQNAAGWNTVANFLITPTGVLTTENLLGEIFNKVTQLRTILNETDSSWSNLEM